MFGCLLTENLKIFEKGVKFSLMNPSRSLSYADIGIVAWGKSLEESFYSFAQGLFY